MLDKDDSCLKWDGAEGAGWLKFHCATQNSHNLKLCCAGASRQSQSGPENVHNTAEKENYSKRMLQQRWGREDQTHLHEGTQSDHDFIQHLIFIQESMRKTRQLAFFLVDLYILQKVTRNLESMGMAPCYYFLHQITFLCVWEVCPELQVSAVNNRLISGVAGQRAMFASKPSRTEAAPRAVSFR